MTGLPDPSERAAFFSTARGKLISALAVVALVVGIAAEGVIGWKNKVETDVASATASYADKLKAAEAEIAELKVKTESETARNAEELKLSEARRMTAEAEEKAQLAKKATADAETAREAANNAAKLKIAEAEERTQLAKKAAADAETQRLRLTMPPVCKLLLRARRKKTRKICDYKIRSLATTQTATATGFAPSSRLVR